MCKLKLFQVMIWATWEDFILKKPVRLLFFERIVGLIRFAYDLVLIWSRKWSIFLFLFVETENIDLVKK